MSQRIPRLEMNELDPRIRDMLGPRVERLGYLGEFFKCAAHVPDVLYHFYQMTEALKDALPDKLTEVVALTVAKRMANDYELHQHERLSLKLGFGDAWVRAVEACTPGTAELDAAERLTQAYTLATLAGNGKGVAREFDALAAAVGPAQAMAVVMLIGRYVAHALTVNTLELAPPVASPLAPSTPRRADRPNRQT
jgi:alkylhydroperoxidase family enzyme